LQAVEVGNASSTDVLKLKIRQNDLREQKKQLQSAFNSEESRFINLLNRESLSKSFFVPDSLGLPEERIRPESLSDELDRHPELIKFDEKSQAVQQLEKLNKKEAAPQLAIGLDYMPMSKLHSIDFQHNGKDMFMPNLSVSIPVFTHKYNSRTRQNKLEQQRLQAEKNARENILASQLTASLQKQQAARFTYQ